jgi:methyl-accepting chemotaxis protein
MKTSRIKVTNLLIAGYGVVCLFLGVIIVISLGEQAKLNAATAVIADQRWPRIESSTQVRLRVTDIAVALRSVMLSDLPAQRQRQIDSIEKYRADADEQMAKLDQRMTAPDEKAALQQVRRAIQVYTDGQRQLLAMVQAGRDADAREYLHAELMPMLQACRDALKQQIGIEVDAMQAARLEAERAYTSTRFNMQLLGGLALLLSAGAATLIMRRLRRDLGGEPDQAARVAERVADGDLTGAIALRDGDTSSLMYQMEHMRDNLSQLVAQVRGDTDHLASASAQIAAGNLDLSARTEQQAASLQETAAAMEQLTVTVQQNTEHADLANQLAMQASAAAAKGGEAMAAVTARMSAIHTSAGQMADIIGVIDGIAFQTNILALNAAVEAARAGNAGQGFAVVAAEVRQLAQRSAGAAREIGALIQAAVAQADAGGAQVAQAGGAMQDIVASVEKVEAIMAQIKHASAEQQQGIVACGRAVVDMDQGTQQNAALVEQVAAAAQAMQNQSAQLAQAVGRFRIEAAGTPARNASVAVRRRANAGPPRIALDVHDAHDAQQSRRARPQPA